MNSRLPQVNRNQEQGMNYKRVIIKRRSDIAFFISIGYVRQLNNCFFFQKSMTMEIHFCHVEDNPIDLVQVKYQEE